MSDKTALETLLEGIQAGQLDESTKSSISTLINETVEARVSAKEKLLSEAYATKEKELETTKAALLSEAAENEKILVEEAEKYKSELEATVLEEAKVLKQKVEEEKEKFKAEANKILLEEAQEYKANQNAALVEEVKKFKVGLIDKVSEYLEAKLSEAIPAEIMESAARIQVLEPLVEGIMKSFSGNFIKLDTTGYKLIKEAKEEIARLETEVQKSMKDIVVLKKEKREVERHSKIKSLTEGLTSAQREKAVKLLEDVEIEKLETHYESIRDIVTEVSTKPEQKVVQKIEESAKPEVKTVVQTPAKPIADSTAIEFQKKKILNESDKSDASTKTSPKKEATPMNNWAGRVQPKYTK